MSTVYELRRLFPTGSLAIKEEALDYVSRHKLFFILSFSFAFCFSQPLVVSSCVPFNCIHTFCICPCDNVPTKSSCEYVLRIFDVKRPPPNVLFKPAPFLHHTICYSLTHIFQLQQVKYPVY